MGSFFVAAVFLLLATVHGVPEMPSIQELMESHGDHDFSSLGELNDYLRSLLDISNLHMAKAFATETRRYKRALDLNSVTVNGTEDVSLIMENPSKFNVTNFDGAKRLHVVSTEDNDYLLLSYGTDHILVEEMPNSYGIRLVTRFNTSQEIKNPNYVTTIITNGKLWIAIASSSKNLIATVYVDLATGATETPQIILGKGLIGGLHMFQSLTGIYLVVGMREPRNEFGEPLTASTYQLVSKYFDNQENLGFQAKNVSDITGFSYRGNYYIVFGMMHSEGSQVYKFDVMIQSMTLIQQLPDTDVNSVLHFLELQENKHYIIVNNGISPKIYRWAGEQLLLWQDLDVSGLTTPLGNNTAFSVSELESLLLLGSGGKITFYADDVSANFMKNYELVSNCFSIGDLALITMGDGYVLFYVCQERLGGSKVEYKKVIMEQILLEKPLDTTDRLLGCLEEVQNDLDARKPDIKFLEEIVQNDTLMTTDKSQNWFAKVTFLQGLTVNGSTSLHNVNITGNVQQNNYTFDNILNMTLPLEDAITTLKDNLENLLYHTGDQQIRGSINSTLITVDKFDSNSSKIKEINGMPLLDLDNTFMIDGIEQNISSSMTLHTLSTDNFTTRDNTSATINGVETENLLRKQLTSQVVTGNHKYESLVASSISGESGSLLVNGVNTSQIVTTGSSVTLYDEKTCKNLTVQQKVEILYLNDVDLSTLQDSLVYKNVFKTQILAGNYSFETLNVTANVDASLINDVDMKVLDSKAVKKTQNFNIKGKVNYQNITVATLDSPKLNNISWSNMVRDDTTTISGNYHFLNATVTTSVVSDSVNGLDISEDVVTINTAQNLKGKLTFTDDLVVNGSQGLQMSQGSTINNIDPLSLLSMDHLGNLIIKSNVTFNSTLQVSEHVIANMINQLDMTNIENRYWRKAYPQDVMVSPTLLNATFGGSVTGGTLNGRQMTEFLKREGLQTITGNYKFENETRVNGSINARDGKTINGIDLSVLEQNTVTKDQLEEINAETTMAGKLSISGDLVLNGFLNRWNVTSDFIRLDQTLQHTGNLTFTSKTMVNSLNIANADFLVQTLNGLDVRSSADDLVLVNENATITGSLEVTGTAQVKELNVTGFVDGVDLEDLADRSLKKSSTNTQLVTGRLTVDNLVFGQSPSLDSVNSNNWTAHLTSVVPLDYNGSIGGSKTFTQLLAVAGNFEPSIINGVINVTALGQQILTKNTAQNISTRYTFSTNVTTSNLNAEVIDSVNTSNLLLVDQNSSVSGTITFAENVLMNDLRSTSGILDGCDLVQVNSSAVWKSNNGSLEIDFPITVTTLVVTQNATASAMKAGSSKRDMKNFLDNVVTKSDAQDISGLIEFTTDVAIGNLTAKSVDGVDMDVFYSETVQKNSDIVINCDLEFAKTLSADKITVGSNIIGRDGGKVLINGLNVLDIHSKAVPASGGTFVITGDKTFLNGLDTTELSVDGSLMNVPVSDLVVLSNHSKLASDLVFQGPITVKGSVQVDGLLDGVNIDNLLANRIELDSNEVLTSNTTFGNLVVEGNLVVDSINHINFAEIVLTSGRTHQEITGSKNLAGGLFVNGETEALLINGVDILNLNQTVVRKNKAAMISKEIVFDSSVSSEASVDVTGQVNGFDLSELGYEESRLKDKIEVQNNRLQTLNATLSEVHVDNLQLSCGMYETVTYGAEVLSTSARVWGKMTSGRWDNKTLLSVIDCSGGCSCPPQSDLYEVNDDGTLTEFRTEDYSALLLNGGNFTGLAVFHTCNNTGEAVVKARTNVEMEVVLNPEIIRDAVSFAIQQPNGTKSTYIVTASYPLGTPENSTILDVLLVQLDVVYVVQSIETPHSATTLDLQRYENGWHLLVANKKAFNDSVDPYTVPSQLYRWENGQFVLLQEVIGEHVTSGMFVTSKTVETEKFVSLTQYKAADSETSEENLRHNTEVLIFKYGSNGFLPYQSLHSYGVVGQTSMTIGNDLYLLLLSSSSGTLDIYDHKPSEGFQFHQRIKVCEEPVDLVNTGEESRTVYISCMNPSEILTITFYVKGFSYLV